MNPLHQRLYATYNLHYTHVNPSEAFLSRIFRSYTAEFGSLVNLTEKKSYLDVGCGSGLLLDWLSKRAPKASIHGLDSSHPMAEVARARLNESAQIHECDGVQFLSQHQDEFDGIFATDILEHMDDEYLPHFLDAARLALKPGGFLAVKVPNMSNISCSELRYRDATHLRGFTEKSLAQCFRAFDFVDCYCQGIIPDSIGMRLRIFVEKVLHRVIFRVCGHTDVSIFTRTITAVGYRDRSTRPNGL